jgi:hypothetical protein
MPAAGGVDALGSGALGAAVALMRSVAAGPARRGAKARYVLTSLSITSPSPVWSALGEGIVVDGAKVSLGSVCEATRARIRAHDDGDVLRVAFSKWRWVSGGIGSFSGSVGQFYGGGSGGRRLVRQSRCEGPGA